ncbi:CPCC family cysteine-rich protein [Streptomyces sp. NBC_00193]|uniref:CPCC family cysteine-rich protein n=1 Tax=Streptomyces sp. NBC_00193 TaxID=2975675 RepID=UPI002B1E5CD7|nr:CPCC family cysteine-rich protein [Streptomyces sp. NBC_00193]
MTVTTGASPCIVCGSLTVRARGDHEICPVCGWQDDGGDYRDPDRYVGGPNHVTLREARQNYEEFGASERRRIDRVRPPLPEEVAPSKAEATTQKPSWLDFVDNPEVVVAVYGEQSVPELDGITVREVRWHMEGPSVLIRFDLPTYPDAPPREWGASRSDTAQVELLLLDAAAGFEAGQGSSSPVGSITFDEGSVAPMRVTLDAERVRARVNAQRAVIQRLSGYLRSESREE